MLKNYLKIALRNLRRHPGYSLINVLGLAAGLAVCVLCLLYVQDELAFDRFHPGADRIARVLAVKPSPDQGDQTHAQVPPPAGPAMVEAFPEVEAATRFIYIGRNTVQRDDVRFYVGDYLLAEPSFFDVLDGFRLERGDPATALSAPHSIVLTQESARRYFGDEDPLGQTLTVEGVFGEMTVTGVLAELPKNSHLQFSMLFPFASLDELENWRTFLDNWDTGGGMYTYVRLADEQDMEAVEAKLPALLARNRSDETVVKALDLQPLPDVHFNSAHVLDELNAAKGERAYVYIFSAIALFVLLIACINYMNLATARSLRRAREVGVRKAVGAQRGQLVRQFLGEALVVAGLALVIALGLVAAALPAFNELANKTMALQASAPFVLGLLGVVAVVGIVAGSYPAFYLSRFRPAKVLKGAVGAESGAARLRRGLVVAQFALSVTLIIATLVVYRQMDYIQTKRLGFDDTHLVVIDINNGDVRRDFRTVKQAFAEATGVEQVAVSSRVPGDWKDITQIEAVPDNAPETERTTMAFLGIDEDFLGTYQMRLLDGRDFDAGRPADSAAVLLNETAARALGWSDPVGKRLRVPDAGFDARVIGVVEDFHFRSLHEQIGPLVLGYHNNPVRVIDYFTARINGADVPATLDALRRVGEQFDPTHPFEYNFLDERLSDFYVQERRVGTLFGIAAGLAVLIACLGLFGLAAFAAEQRTKEIGVRKVLGASVPDLVALLSKDFLVLVAVAFVVAAPVAYFLMQAWLDDFAYRVGLGPGMFVLAGALALGIALLTVSYHAVRAATADPVKSLRYE